MTKKEKLEIVKNLYPDAKIELNYETPFQLLVAVILSAQTTDIQVNIATKTLFGAFKSEKELSEATEEEVYPHLKKLGLAKTKTRNIIKTAKIINNNYNGVVPDKREVLMSLPGVGQKTANVVLANIYNQNYIAVDTHIWRIAKRLAIIPEDKNELYCEKTLARILREEDLNQYHHSLIFFGRYHCLARNPKCEECPLKDNCRWLRKNAHKRNKML